MFWNLLASESSSSGNSGGCNALSFLPWLLIIGAAILLWFFSRRSQQKQQEQINATLDAIQPGNKVKTIGGICGVVVEVCAEDNTFILETGSEESGKSYIKLDKKAVYQTDAVPATAAVEETPAEESAETPFEETEAPATEVPATEAPAEENAESVVAPAEEVEKKEE